ncbi:IS630 family transposase [Fimbriiglobus ruber]|nr:IS630 family transposase [Fimbriiglobus ruber]
MRPKGTAAELERRRRRAVELLERGETPAMVARILGVTPTSLHRWRRMGRQTDGLVAKPASGAKRRLSSAQLAELERLLSKGATAHGFPNELWTAARVAKIILRHFGVPYHHAYVRRLLRRRLHWTSHKPQRRARPRNDKEVERWKADEFPRILREAYRRRAHIAFLDESGFMLQPLVRRTLAPRGKRVVMRCSAKHDRVSAISCVTLSPKAMHVGLYSALYRNRNVHGEEVVEFLTHLTHKVPGEWTVVWDGNNIHSKSKVVKTWLAQHSKVVVEDFPSYDPQNNPDEWVWSGAKYGTLCNLCPADLEELFKSVLQALEELKHQPSLLASFVLDAGVPLCL